MPPRKIKVVDLLNDIEDVPDPQPCGGDVKAIENETPIATQITPPPSVEEPQSQEKQAVNLRTVELVECPDCNKQLTKKSLRYSHAKNCIAKKNPVEEEEEEAVEVVEEEERAPLHLHAPSIEEAVEEEEEEEEELPKPPPKLKRTVSIRQPVKKTVTKVKQPKTEIIGETKHTLPSTSCNDQVKPTITNIYGREHRDERVRHMTKKMNTLFVNAIS